MASMLSGVDRAFLQEQKARAGDRARRFAEEAKAPPPPLPTHRRTVASGKVAKPTSQHDVVTAFLRRKLSAGLVVHEAVLEKARGLGIDVAAIAEEAVADQPTLPVPESPPPKRSKTARGFDADADLDAYWQSRPRSAGGASPARPAPPSSSSAASDEVIEVLLPAGDDRINFEQNSADGVSDADSDEFVQWMTQRAARGAASRPAGRGAGRAAPALPSYTPLPSSVTAGARDFPAAAVMEQAAPRAEQGGRGGVRRRRRGTLGMLLLNRERNLRTSTCRAFFFRGLPWR